MARVSAHVTETHSRDFLRSKIDSFFPDGSALFRELTERDYGTDAIVEIFENGLPTGKIAYLQLKSTSKRIVPLKTSDAVSCPSVSVSNLEYAIQKRIPVMLTYISTEEPKVFYYIDLNSVADTILTNISEGQKNVTVRIPSDNLVMDDLSQFFEKIEEYYR